MHVKIMKTIDSDRVILVSSVTFLQCVDKLDFECRSSEVIKSLYQRSWFFSHNDEPYFIPPAIYISNGEILFINGRHRTIVLARHLRVFPVLVGNLDMDHCGGAAKRSSLEILEKIKLGEIQEDSNFNLPDLEFGDFSRE